jgi:hypothetical protein
MFDKFVDELRMLVAKSKPESGIENVIRQRLKPKMAHAASKGEQFIEFKTGAPETLNPTGMFVKNHWVEVKAYFEKNGLTCDAINSDTFVISWE